MGTMRCVAAFAACCCCCTSSFVSGMNRLRFFGRLSDRSSGCVTTCPFDSFAKYSLSASHRNTQRNTSARFNAAVQASASSCCLTVDAIAQPIAEEAQRTLESIRRRFLLHFLNRCATIRHVRARTVADILKSTTETQGMSVLLSHSCASLALRA